MKILAVSDTIVDHLYAPGMGEHFRDVGLVLGCGDLPFEYLEFLVSSLNVPLLYVPGNHDPASNERNPAAHAEGCENIDRRAVRVQGLIVAGLGGSVRYRPGGANQHSQAEMYLRAALLLPALLWQRLRSGRRPDILIAHSPPRGIHDEDDPAHRGFSAFLPLLRLVRPRYFLHGHTLVYKSNLSPTVTRFGATTIINVYPYRILEVEEHVR